MSAAASLPLIIAALLAIAFGLAALTIWYWRATDPDRLAVDNESVRLTRIPELRVDPVDDGSVLGPIPASGEIPALFRIDTPPPVLAHRAATETVEVDTLAILEARVRADTASPNMLSRQSVDLRSPPPILPPLFVRSAQPATPRSRIPTTTAKGPVEPETRPLADGERGPQPDHVEARAERETVPRLSHEPTITESEFFAGFSLQEWSSVVGSVLANLSNADNANNGPGAGPTIDIDDSQSPRDARRAALSADTTLRS